VDNARQCRLLLCRDNGPPNKNEHATFSGRPQHISARDSIIASLIVCRYNVWQVIRLEGNAYAEVDNKRTGCK